MAKLTAAELQKIAKSAQITEKTKETYMKRAEQANAFFEDLGAKLAGTFEAARIAAGMTVMEFSQILGISYDSYYKRIYPYSPKVQKPIPAARKVSFSAREVFLLCYIFGLDLNTICDDAATSFISMEQAIMEFASQMAVLEDDILLEFQKTVLDSNIPFAQKRLTSSAIVEFIEYRKKVRETLIENTDGAKKVEESGETEEETQ